MRKKIMIAGFAGALLVILALITGLSNIGPIIESAVNTYGPDLTKTEVRLDDVSVSLLSGTARLSGFLLGSPDGFDAPHVMQVGAITMSIDKGSLTEDMIVVDEIVIEQPEIVYERSGGRDNFTAILANIEQSLGLERAAEPVEEQSPRTMLVRRFAVKDGKVKLAMSLGKDMTISVPLPDIEMENIGGEKASPGEVSRELLSSIYKQISTPDVMGALNSGLKNIGEGAKKGMEAAKDKVKGLFGR
jgi:hypothetical protein